MALPLEFSASVSDLCSASCLHVNKILSFSDPLYMDLQESMTFDARYHKGCCLFVHCRFPVIWNTGCNVIDRHPLSNLLNECVNQN